MAETARTGEPRWLLLLHQLPTHPSKARVKTWRRLQQSGVIPLRNSACVLPKSAQSHEDFEWLTSEILAMGGQASVFAADPIEADAEREIVPTFRAARGGDYKSLLSDLAVLERRTRIGSRVGGRGQAAAVRRTVRAYRSRACVCRCRRMRTRQSGPTVGPTPGPTGVPRQNYGHS
jgi:hypothetical protein